MLLVPQPFVTMSKTGCALKMGIYQSLVNHKDTSHSWVSVSSGMQKRVDITFF